ncbi:MAG TPA: ATP-binding protein [Thermoanaerobaculia bacterium]|nr:ATP-binding protein [Thermoanaerobaculia bacterium]
MMHGRPHSLEAIRVLSSHPAARIVQTRLLAAIALLLIANLTTVFANPAQVSWILLAYMVLTCLLAFLRPTLLEQKRARLIKALVDMVAISCLVKASGGLASSWFLLYLFPIMSASRYLGPGWSLTVATSSTLMYGLATGALLGRNVPALYSFGFRAVILEGVALLAANLARTRDRAEAKLMRAIERIDREILADTDLDQLMASVLNSAMELTESDLSAIVLIDGERANGTFTAAKRPERDASTAEAESLLEQHHRRVLDSRQPLALPEWRVRKASLEDPPAKSARWSGRLVPLEIDGTPFGVLGVFSTRSLHYYTPNDLQKLSSMASLIAMARKNAKQYGELKSRNMESKQRLQMLYDIGGQLKAEQGLELLFRNVVALVSTQLCSEEAALFIPDNRGFRIEKAAVSGPDDETTKKLAEIELSYDENKRSLTRMVFETKVRQKLNQIPFDEDYVGEYSRRLPSGTTRHYMGVPLLIGDEVLGVIRVLNKKAENYAPLHGKANLAAEGFGEDDFELLTLIATQVASAIRNAKFIERNSYFENLVNNSPDPIMVLDKNGKIQNFNRECEKISGLRERDVLGQSVEKYYESADHAKEIGRALWKTKDHTIRDYPARIRDAQEALIPVRLSATWILDKDGRKVGSIGVFKDERERLRLEEEKLRSEKLAALGRLAQTTAHDIKHDIGVVLNYVEGLESESLTDTEMHQAWSAIRDAMNKARGKVQNMLMTAGPKPPEKEILSFKSVLSKLAVSMESRASAARVVFFTKYPDGDPLLHADPDQLRQVFTNLFDNSLDAIKLARHVDGRQSAGKIDVTVEVDKASLLVSWHDDGCGMSEEEKTRAFAAFYTTKTTGSGLGLFITKTIIENHSGQITVETAADRGVCFRIALPLFSTPESPEVTSS